MPLIFTKNIAIVIVVAALSSVTCKKGISDPVSSTSIAEFEVRLDQLRTQSKIPGMVAGIVKDGQIIWTKSYGYENIETGKPVTNSTIFHLASLTKTFASTVIMQLVKEGKINLDDPVSNYGVVLNEQGIVRVIHLLTHTSEGIPGTTYKYNGDRFAELSNVIRFATGKNFIQHATERIMLPLALQNTAPSVMSLASANGFDTTMLKANTAQGYHSNGVSKVTYPTNFSAAAGLTSNIEDMLKYAMAYDENFLLTDDLKLKVFSPMISNSGKTLPYGLGWFVQEKEGVGLAWHYGYWVGMSSLIIRVPGKKLSFVLMANSDMLSAPYPLGKGDLWDSPYAREFLKSFALTGAKL
jgi:CubicO group peptidase (beta-lactamase class C family)